ncbi:MAG: SLC13 family permease [Ignavibacteriales bacterium]|nr:SLC13 family permease [Ignavibacteriales bacterium]MCF8314509.1 SLC13 family permease [Ignavibacteriales bacterium]MCF8436454.1 SLC13 family permease [Ignavibacteriales bacterium]
MKKRDIITGRDFKIAFVFFAAFFVYFICPENWSQSQSVTASAAFLMATLWITELIDLGITSLLPLIIFPLTGALSAEETAGSYINSTIILFLGGFMIALAMEKHNLHRRIALYVISFFGTGLSRLILGFMVSGAFLSMWISNTATAVMLLPVALSVIKKFESAVDSDTKKKFSQALLIGIAYSCSIGGIATLIGTPPNLVFQRIYSIAFKERAAINFGEWLSFGLPLAVIFLFLTWLLLTKVIFRFGKNTGISIDFKSEINSLETISAAENRILRIFIITAFLWIFRLPINLGTIIIPGWSSVFPVPEFIDDGTIAICMAFLLFIIPAEKGISKERILDAGILQKIPWNIILLFGGGFALAASFMKSGLSQSTGELFSGLTNHNPVLIVLAMCLFITFLTELTSNTATANIFLPVTAAIAVSTGADPRMMMIAATLSCSMAFMLPVATPPNAIVFGSGMLNVKTMAKSGLLLNILGAFLITFFVWVFFG